MARPGHGADHVLPLLAPPSLTVPVVGGRLGLGTWQSICLLDPNPDNAIRDRPPGFLGGYRPRPVGMHIAELWR